MLSIKVLLANGHISSRSSWLSSSSRSRESRASLARQIMRPVLPLHLWPSCPRYELLFWCPYFISLNRFIFQLSVCGTLIRVMMSEICWNLLEAISPQTVCQEFHEMGFHSRTAAHKPHITIHNGKYQLELCKTCCNCTLEQLRLLNHTSRYVANWWTDLGSVDATMYAYYCAYCKLCLRPFLLAVCVYPAALFTFHCWVLSSSLALSKTKTSLNLWMLEKILFTTNTKDGHLKKTFYQYEIKNTESTYKIVHQRLHNIHWDCTVHSNIWASSHGHLCRI